MKARIYTDETLTIVENPCVEAEVDFLNIVYAGRWVEIIEQLIDLPLVLDTADFVELFGSKQMTIITVATSGSPTYDWEIAALWQRMTIGPRVRYDNPLVAQGMSALVSKGLITQTEFDTILAGNKIA